MAAGDAGADHGQLAALARAARDGDLHAYGRIVALTRPAVEAAARRVVHDPQDAEEVAQEAYLQAFHALAELAQDRALLAWLLRIARNRALNRVRARHDSFVADVDAAQVAADLTEEDERGPALARALVALADGDRRLCERYYHGGWTTARLAQEMGLAETAVRKRLQRIRQRLRREMAMGTTDLPQRIVELLSKPNLTALPENPVGAVWEVFRRHYEGFEEVELPERIDPEAVRRALGDAPGTALEEHLEAAAQQQGLRRELTAPLLVAAARHGAPVRLIARGKAYRLEDEEGPTKLHAFHQAEVLWVEEGLDEWRIMGPITDFVHQLSGEARLRIEEAQYSLYCERGWEVCAQWPGQGWKSVAGWGRMRSGVVERLGYDPRRFAAVGVGVGLERLACLRYGIDDIRRVEAERV